LLYYPGKAEHLTLVSRKDKEGNCVGAMWKKYYRHKGSNVWLSGWSIPKTPVQAVKKRMDDEDIETFVEIHTKAKAIHKVRTELVAKRKKILGTIRTIDSYRVKQWAKLKETVGKLEPRPKLEKDEE
jgi:hypothetical protein